MAALVLDPACDGDAASPSEARPPALGLRTLVDGEAHLTGFAVGACSQGRAAAQHCAFFRKARQDDTRTELWVVDMTAVLGGGTSAPCDGSSPACVRLTGDLFTGTRIETPSHPEAHRFDGDTLLYLADPAPAADQLNRYEGRVYAWRPGWRKGRALTGERGVLCHASATAAAAWCVDGVADRPTLSFELRAGMLSDTDAQLPVVERIRPFVGGSLAWSAKFAPNGTDLVYSSWRSGEPGQALRVLPLGPSSAPASASRQVISEGEEYEIAADGRTVYFKRGGVRDHADLWAAEFPSGEGATQLAKDVNEFALLGGHAGRDEGLLIATELRGLESVLQVMRDHRRPREARELSRDAHYWYPSPDGRFTYILEVTSQGDQGSVANNDTGGICRLGSYAEAQIYNPTFFPSQGALLWTEEDRTDPDETLSFLGRPQDCGGIRPLGAALEKVLPIGSGLVYAGRRTSRKEDPIALFHAPTPEPGRLLGQGQLVLEGIDLENLVLVPAAGGDAHDPRALLVGTTKDAPSGPGLHVFGPFAPSGGH